MNIKLFRQNNNTLLTVIMATGCIKRLTTHCNLIEEQSLGVLHEKWNVVEYMVIHPL